MADAPFQQTWWEKNLDTQMETFRSWIGSHKAESKVFCRRRVAAAGYRSILDCGCGLCTEYDGYKSDGYAIDYKGLDVTPKLVQLARDRGIDVTQGYLEQIPLPDQCVDVVYIRHVLEHLPHHAAALREAVRVARKEVLVVFFRKPREGPDNINHNPASNLYHNGYNRQGIEDVVRAQPRFRELSWLEVNRSENVLSILLG